MFDNRRLEQARDLPYKTPSRAAKRRAERLCSRLLHQSTKFCETRRTITKRAAMNSGSNVPGLQRTNKQDSPVPSLRLILEKQSNHCDDKHPLRFVVDVYGAIRPKGTAVHVRSDPFLACTRVLWFLAELIVVTHKQQDRVQVIIRTQQKRGE